MLEKFYKLVALCHGQFTADSNFLTKFELFAAGKYTELAQMLAKNIDGFINDIKAISQDIKSACQEKNIPNYYTNEYGMDEDVINWHPDTESIDAIETDGKFEPVDTENGTTEEAMLKTAVKMSRKQAGKKFAEMIRNGEFDKNETYRIIFLNETRNGVPLELFCLRFSDGELRLYVDGVFPDDRWNDAASAWFSSNK